MNREQIIKFYKFLRHKNQTELRLIEPKWKNPKPIPIQKWINNSEEFLKTIEKFNSNYNIYAGINERKNFGDKDEDVEFITNIGHDIDAHGINSNFQKAQEVAFKIKDDCIKNGYNEPLIICSGRGFWVIHHISPIKNTEENRKKIKEFGKKIKHKYESKGIELDSSVYNVSRIARVPGTLNISDKNNKIESFIVNDPLLKEDLKLADAIIDIELKTYSSISTGTNPKNSCAFMDYCLTHEIPLGERHKIISRNMSLYICDNPDREILREQYVKIQKGSGNELVQWLKSIDKNGKEKYPFSCGELINFQKKYKIPIKCKGCPKYKEYRNQLKENERVKKINKIQEKNYNSLQKKVFTALALKDKEEATELIVKEIKSNNHIYTTRDDIKSEMWIYDNGIYVPQGKSFVKEFSRKILEQAFSTQLANQIIAKIETDTYIEHEEFFNTNYINEVPVQNGILNIFNRSLNDFTPDKIFFNKLPIKYDPDADCQNILEHLNTVLNSEEDVKVLLEIFGYLLLKEYKIEKAFMFVGHGRNGKSKTIELMKRFIGVENCSGLPLRSLTEESFSLSELFGKMANLSADLSKTDLKETGTIKALIGRDLIQAKRKYLRDLNFVNYAKMIFAANELPRIYDTTDGFWTKWVLIEFPYKFVTKEVYNISSEEDKKKLKIINPDIIQEITTNEELSGLLNLALDSLDNLLKNKDFSYSKSTAEVKDLWIRQSDSFTAFCTDHISENINGIISKKLLRVTFHRYCKKHKIPSVSDKAIKITLESLFGVYDSQNKNYDRVWEGIDFKNLDKLNNNNNNNKKINRDNTFFIP